MQTCVQIKLRRPNAGKRLWLEDMADRFARAVDEGLRIAFREKSCSRNKLHPHIYPEAKKSGLPSNYAVCVVTHCAGLKRATVSKWKQGRRASRPSRTKPNIIAFRSHVYRLVQDNGKWALRMSDGNGKYLWFPLLVPERYEPDLDKIRGEKKPTCDAKLIRRKDDWYLLLAADRETRKVKSDRAAGVDLGLARHAVVWTPEGVSFYDAKRDRFRRERFAIVRKRLQRQDRMDRVKQMKGKEQRWMKQVNHIISKQIVEQAHNAGCGVIALEKLEGIRQRTVRKKDTKWNRMMAGWTFYQLTQLLKYKAEIAGLDVVSIDPRNSSKTCPECGRVDKKNRREQSLFKCCACGYQANADYVAARNISAAGLYALQHRPSSTARPERAQDAASEAHPDGASVVSGGAGDGAPLSSMDTPNSSHESAMLASYRSEEKFADLPGKQPESRSAKIDPLGLVPSCRSPDG